MIAKTKKNIVPKGGDTEIGSFGWVAGFGCLFNIYPWITFVDDTTLLCPRQHTDTQISTCEAIETKTPEETMNE